jgi:hypothetical protein
MLGEILRPRGHGFDIAVRLRLSGVAKIQFAASASIIYTRQTYTKVPKLRDLRMNNE